MLKIVLHTDSCLNDNFIYESRDVEFFELVFPLNKTITENVALSRVDMVNESTSTDHVNELRRSKRKRTKNIFGPDFLTAFIVEKPHKINEQFVSIFLIGDDPKTYKEALSSIDSSFWKEAIKSELDSIMMNHTWDLVDLPKGSKPIKCKWIFKKKKRLDGSIEKFKPRLVVVGYTQKEGIYYFDTYSPMT